MEKIKEQWSLRIDFKQGVRHLLNFIIGCLVISFLAISLSFIVVVSYSLIIKFFKYGYGLW